MEVDKSPSKVILALILLTIGFGAVCGICALTSLALSYSSRETIVSGGIGGPPAVTSTPTWNWDSGTTEQGWPTLAPLPSNTQPSLTVTFAPLYTLTPRLTETPAVPELPAITHTRWPTYPPKNDTVLPLMVSYDGVGDSVLKLDLDKVGGAGVLQIEGNQARQPFSVTCYEAADGAGKALVDTSEPYFGRRPVNIDRYDQTSRLEIKATGAWHIDLMSLSPELIDTLETPGAFAGEGDNVLLLRGQVPDFAQINGNQAGGVFIVVSHRELWDLLVNTTVPYSSHIKMPPNTQIIEVIADGEWSIEITGK